MVDITSPLPKIYFFIFIVFYFQRQPTGSNQPDRKTRAETQTLIQSACYFTAIFVTELFSKVCAEFILPGFIDGYYTNTVLKMLLIFVGGINPVLSMIINK